MNNQNQSHRSHNKGYSKRPPVDYNQLIEDVFDKNYQSVLLNMVNSTDNELVNKIRKFVETYAKDISTSQIRNLYSDIKTAKISELPLKRPKLAYVGGRTDKKKTGMHTLLFMLDELIQKVANKEQHESFNMLFEAILAYHRFYGDSNK